MGRIIRLLAERGPLTAQQRWRRSGKGKLADRRYYEKHGKSAAYKAATIARVKRWRETHRALYLVGQRMRKRKAYKKRPLGPGKGHSLVSHTCSCGRVVRGNGFWSHAKSCQRSPT